MKLLLTISRAESLRLKELSLRKKLNIGKHSQQDKGAKFDKEYSFDAKDIAPMITYGTNPGMGIKISDVIPIKNDPSFGKSLEYMDLNAGESLLNKPINLCLLEVVPLLELKISEWLPVI
jgi:homoaconitase/3-isopropylmalate dehydratase large subunit